MIKNSDSSFIFSASDLTQPVKRDVLLVVIIQVPLSKD